MSVFSSGKRVFKDVKATNEAFVNNATGESLPIKKRGRTKISNKRDKTYTFYCTQDELDELEKKANAKHLTMAEYFRVKLFD